ncbi:serine hydrolase domain-containing protein [Vagococcus vulneris]|uniref:Beta-lactamase-related domain-containing protein n=1 Tax=Vagococcus vulneris TaxID=1977869 RepID=A0A429ZXW4_9ENTE|nr:serine hydrolase domain-containing protein [Vagococcus vulneris]RST98736.1 hypothetical protein CBF37_06725 [Vagococcus vulneris]
MKKIKKSHNRFKQTSLDRIKELLNMKIIGVLFLVLSLIVMFVLKTGQKKDYSVSANNSVDTEEISRLIEETGFIGAVALVKNEKIVYSEGFGYAEKDDGIKNTSDTIFPMASFQKRITSVLIGQLVSEGKLSYTDKLSKFYPNILNSEDVTIRELLDHRSGYYLPELPADKVLTSEEEQIDYAVSETTYDSSHDYAYSNGNYVFLAAIIRKVDGGSYANSLQKRILNPVGMKHTYTWDKVPDNEIIAEEYMAVDGNYSKEERVYSDELMSTLLGAGSLYTTVDDLAKFEIALSKNTLLTKEEQDTLFYRDKTKDLGMQMKQISGNISSDAMGVGGYNSFMYGDQANNGLVITLYNQLPSVGKSDFAETIYDEIMSE